MDVKQRVEIISSDLDALKAEVEQGGGGGDLSAYLTKEEASSTYETQTSATEALALKADKSTTYTKSEVDEAIAAAGGDLDLTPVSITLDNGMFPEDKMSVLQKHLPIKINGEDLVFLGFLDSYYTYGSFSGWTREDNLSIRKIYIINGSNRNV